MPEPWTPASARKRRTEREMPRQKAAVTGHRSSGGLGWLARILGFMAVITLVVQLIDRGVISWGRFLVVLGVVSVVGMVLGQVFVVPRLARKGSKHPRINTTQAWESPLSPAKALARIREELADLEPAVQPDDSSLQVSVGSDVTFRRRGTSSEVGWQALPLLATFRATPNGTGCQITAEARDNLGWYPDPPVAFVEDEILKRNTALIERARGATDR